jgi:hypothetical protein
MKQDAIPTIPAAALATVTGGRFNPAGGGPMNVMTVLDNPGRAVNNAMDAVGAGNNTRPGQTYVPAQMGKDGSITQGQFKSSNPSPVPRSK